MRSGAARAGDGLSCFHNRRPGNGARRASKAAGRKGAHSPLLREILDALHHLPRDTSPATLARTKPYSEHQAVDGVRAGMSHRTAPGGAPGIAQRRGSRARAFRMRRQGCRCFSGGVLTCSPRKQPCKAKLPRRPRCRELGSLHKMHEIGCVPGLF